MDQRDLADLLTPTQTAQRLGVATSTVIWFANVGKLTPIIIGGRRHFDITDVDSLARKRVNDPRAWRARLGAMTPTAA